MYDTTLDPGKTPTVNIQGGSGAKTSPKHTRKTNRLANARNRKEKPKIIRTRYE